MPNPPRTMFVTAPHAPHPLVVHPRPRRRPKVENEARFFSYRLLSENTLATWVRNAVLTMRVALAVHHHVGLAHAATIVTLLSLGAVLSIGWALYRFVENSRTFRLLLERNGASSRWAYSSYDGVWAVAAALLAAGVGLLGYELVDAATT